MSGSLLLVVVLVALALTALAVVVLVLVLVLGSAPSPSRAAQAARRHAAVVHAVALGCLVGAMVAGPAVVAQVATGPVQGVYLGLVPAVAGLTFAAVHALGELTWPRPSGMVRRAPLTRRTSGDVAPGWLRRVLWGWAALAVVTLVGCGLAADGGRAISRSVSGGSSSSGPFPGWYFGVPLLVAVVVVVVAAEGVLRLVADRPVVSDADPRWDGALRRLSAHRVLRGAQLVLAWTTAGVLVVAGAAVRNVGTEVTPDGVTTAVGAYPAVGLTLLLLGLAIAIAGLVVAVVPGTPVGEQAPAGDLDRVPA